MAGIISVKKAFDSLPGGKIGMSEFKEFWDSLSDQQKESYSNEAVAAGF